MMTGSSIYGVAVIDGSLYSRFYGNSLYYELHWMQVKVVRMQMSKSPLNFCLLARCCMIG